MKKILIPLLLATLMSCSVKKKITTDIRHDSVAVIRDTIRIVEKDTMVIDTHWIPNDRALITALMECDSMGEVQMKEIITLRSGRNVQPSIRIVNDTIEVECIVDSFAVYNIFRDRYKTEYVGKENTTTVEDSTTIIEKIVKTRWPWWLWVVVIAGGIYLLYTLYRKFLKPL